MNHYYGTGLNASETTVTKRDKAWNITPLDPRFDLRNHSPTGFSWGHLGSGPSQLALAILADAAGDAVALANYQQFKNSVVSQWHNEQFRINGDEVLNWLEDQGMTKTRINFATEMETLAKTAGSMQHKYASLDDENTPENTKAAYNVLVYTGMELKDAASRAARP